MAPIISILLPTIASIIDKLIPDKEAAGKAQAELALMVAKGELDTVAAQLDINKEEAKSSSILVAGWRPFLGWVCGTAFAYTYVLLPFFVFAYTTYTGHALPVDPPKLDAGLYELLFGMLGLGAMRTFEKVKGVAA